MIAINSVNNVTTDLRAIRGSMANETVDVLGYYTPNDGGGGTFYWDALSTALDNGGTIIQATGVTTGRWMRIFDGFIDVKWFGCKGDNVTSDRVNFQRALDFIKNYTANRLNLYISQGTYVIDPPPSGNDCLTLDQSGLALINIYGDGARQSFLRYDPGSDPTNYNIFRIIGNMNCVCRISDFAIVEASLGPGKGLVIDFMQFASVENIFTHLLHTGIELIDVLSSSFKNLQLGWGNIGLNATYSVFSPPNLINFTSCNFQSNIELGVKLTGLYGMHSNTFTSCGFEGNGNMLDNTTGALHAMFVGGNGANGLNVENCYFEANKGGFDIKLDTRGFGSHTFEGNAFNRISSAEYTQHNILIDGNGQSPQEVLGGSKTKLVFLGNGFLASNASGIGYVPSITRKAIELADTSGSNNYWQFDLVEQENQYTYIQPSPNPQIYDADSAPDFDKNTPQISEFTRIKAYGRLQSNGTPIYSYNVASVSQPGAGVYDIVFANPLGVNVYCTSVSPIGTGVIACIVGESNTSVVVTTTDLTGTPIDNDFTFSII